MNCRPKILMTTCNTKDYLFNKISEEAYPKSLFSTRNTITNTDMNLQKNRYEVSHKFDSRSEGCYSGKKIIGLKKLKHCLGMDENLRE